MALAVLLKQHQTLRCRLSRTVAWLPQACVTLQNGLFAPNAGVQPPLCAPTRATCLPA